MAEGEHNEASLDYADYKLKLKLEEHLLLRNNELEQLIRDKDALNKELIFENQCMSDALHSMRRDQEIRAKIYEELDVEINALKETNDQLQLEAEREKQRIDELKEELEFKEEELEYAEQRYEEQCAQHKTQTGKLRAQLNSVELELQQQRTRNAQLEELLRLKTHECVNAGENAGKSDHTVCEAEAKKSYALLQQAKDLIKRECSRFEDLEAQYSQLSREYQALQQRLEQGRVEEQLEASMHDELQAVLGKPSSPAAPYTACACICTCKKHAELNDSDSDKTIHDESNDEQQQPGDLMCSWFADGKYTFKLYAQTHSQCSKLQDCAEARVLCQKIKLCVRKSIKRWDDTIELRCVDTYDGIFDQSIDMRKTCCGPLQGLRNFVSKSLAKSTSRPITPESLPLMPSSPTELPAPLPAPVLNPLTEHLDITALLASPRKIGTEKPVPAVVPRCIVENGRVLTQFKRETLDFFPGNEDATKKKKKTTYRHHVEQPHLLRVDNNIRTVVRRSQRGSRPAKLAEINAKAGVKTTATQKLDELKSLDKSYASLINQTDMDIKQFKQSSRNKTR